MRGIVFKHSRLVSGIIIRDSMGSRRVNHFYRKPISWLKILVYHEGNRMMKSANLNLPATQFTVEPRLSGLVGT